MLDPNERSVLFEAMRPPEGGELDAAIGTTFTLDLVTLLATPLAFSTYGWVESEEKLDAIELLESVRRFVDRVTVFCQAGYIKAPHARQTLLGFLQEAVVEVQAPNPGGVFHPKVWVLRFRGDDGAIRYRLLVLSRNHTFDRSWDTIFSLDGTLTSRRRAFAKNHPLGDFVAALPELAVRDVPSLASERVKEFEKEVRRVEWELPHGLESVAFWPMGVGGYDRIPMAQAERITQMAVVTPFLTQDALEELQELAPICALVSREESLAALPSKPLAGVTECLYMPQQHLDDSSDEANDEVSADGVPPRGLHAKLYVGDDGWNARLWTGSLNTTGAGFSKNVEFVAELYGKKSALGVEALLGNGDEGVQFRSLLAPFNPDDEPDPDLERRRAAQRILDEVRKRLATSPVVGQVTELEDGQLEMAIEFADVPTLSGCTARVWPVTIGEASARPLTEGKVAAAFTVSREAVTPFLAVEIELDDDSAGVQPARFVLNVPLEGLPEGYRDTLLRAALGNREHVLRYLFFLLSETGIPQNLLAGDDRDNGENHGRTSGSADIPLAEELIRTLARSPEKLDQVYTLVRDLQATPEGQTLLPDGFATLWAPIWEARQRLR